MLRATGFRGKVSLGQQSEFGQKFEVSGTLQGPNGRVKSIKTVWLVPLGETGPKFITAFPG